MVAGLESQVGTSGRVSLEELRTAGGLWGCQRVDPYNILLQRKKYSR